MPRSRFRWFALVVIAVAVGLTAAANDLGFSGNVGLEVTYTPVPPASFNIGADFTLGFEVSGFSFASVTGFDLAGFQSQVVSLAVDLGAVQIAEEIRFEPTFSWNNVSVDLAIVGVEIGVDWILANIGTVQTPDYSMGTVIELSSGIVCGFSITSLTGFGAIDLVNQLGGIDAPISYRVLQLFNDIDALCAPPIELDVTIVDGFYFEEELVRLEVDYLGLLASSSVWFDFAGLSSMLFELGYRFDDPSMQFLTSLTIDGSFAVTGLDFMVDVQIDPVRFTSQTSFVEAVAPSPIAIIFGSQRFALSFAICDIIVTTTTGFDASFMFSELLIGLDAFLDPVTFKSLTAFDASGFANQCVYAGVCFSGVTLYTRADFDLTGIQEVVFGFDLTF